MFPISYHPHCNNVYLTRTALHGRNRGGGGRRQEREVWSPPHATSKGQPHTDGARPPRAPGMSRCPQGHWEQPGGALSKELKSGEEVQEQL